MLKKVLKIYVVEDAKSKIRCMKKYFDGVNYLLAPKGNLVESYQNSEKLLKKHEYEQVILENVKTDNEEEEYYNFDSRKNKDFLKKIKEIIEAQENRIFILDLALNTKERAEFQLDQNRLRAQTAKEIFDIIKSSKYKEVVVISSRYTGIEDEYLLILGINKEELCDKIAVEFLPADVFNIRNTEKEIVIAINEVLEEIFEENEQLN